MVSKTISTQPDTAYVTVTYFSLFLGFLGVDRFYMGYVFLGVVKLLTFGGLGIWWLIDFIWIALGNAKTKAGVRLLRTDRDNRIVFIGLAIFLLIQLVGATLSTISYVGTLNSIDNSVSELSHTLEGAVIEATGTGNYEDGDGEGTVQITLPKKN